MKHLMEKAIKIYRLFKSLLRKVKYIFYSKYILYPKILQLPITYLCNFDCVMCGMRKIKEKDFSSDELRVILQNKLFKRISSVGVNGGEPFMKHDLMECICVIVETLPKLEAVHIITNGYFTDKIKESLPKIKFICNAKRVKLNIAVSVDAIGKKQDFCRGKRCSEYVEKTIDFLLSDDGKNCYDDFNIICTITKYNVYDLPEVEVWAETKQLKVNYNIATFHERLNNAEKFLDFTIFNDKLSKQIAEEFFYQKFRETKSERYFCLYYFIHSGSRISPCDYQCNYGVTLTPNKQLAYCATYSNELGDAFVTDANILYRKHFSYRKRLTNEKCERCSHYIYTANLCGFLFFIKEIIKNMRLFY